MISYAQNGEDVVLERAFKGRDSGFYVDVGAADPNNHSVTRHFYEKGWRGINIDPLPAWHEMLERARPEDMNLLAGVSDERGEMVLEVGAEHPGGATFVGEQAAGYRDRGMSMSTVRARLVTLADVCAEHAGNRIIDFLKIDAEGFEARVIQGADWERWRPRVVLVEATEPNSPAPSHQAWEPMLLKAGYVLALFDGLNRFYVRQEDAHLADLLAAPANVFDDFTTAEAARTAAALASARRELDTLRRPAPYPASSTPRNYAFYGEGMAAGRMRFLVVPLRRVLRRLQRPWFLRQEEILHELGRDITGQAAEVGHLRLLVEDLRADIRAQEARSWDQTAITRRLAVLEDALLAIEASSARFQSPTDAPTETQTDSG